MRRRTRWRNFDEESEDFWAIATGQPTEQRRRERDRHSRTTRRAR